MTKFPGPVPLSEAVFDKRVERQKEMIRAARKGVFVRTAIVVAELFGFAYFNSSSLLLDSLSTLIDIGASIFLIFCIKLAARPPDSNHPLGHGRLEPLGGLQLGLILMVTGCVMVFQQLFNLTSTTSSRVIEPFTWVIPFCAVILLEICYRILHRMGTKLQSPALLADAVHYRIDGINTLFAMCALILAAFLPRYSVFIDHVGALVIALLMVVVGTFAARSNLHQLLDRKPSQVYFDRVKGAALRVSGVLCTEKIHVQVYGPDAFVAIDIEVDPLLSVEVAHEITQKVRAEIQHDWPAVHDVIVHVEPYYENDH
jgi:cation diffusion facilitator family transporter